MEITPEVKSALVVAVATYNKEMPLGHRLLPYERALLIGNIVQELEKES